MHVQYLLEINSDDMREGSIGCERISATEHVGDFDNPARSSLSPLYVTVHILPLNGEQRVYPVTPQLRPRCKVISGM